MDSLLAGYGSDSSGGDGDGDGDDDDDGSPRGDDETNQLTESAPSDPKQVPPAADLEERPPPRKEGGPRSPPLFSSSSSSSSLVASPLTSPADGPPPPTESVGAVMAVADPPDPASLRLSFGPGWPCCYPPPETRSDDDNDGATLIHWPNDYVTPLRRRACERLLLLSAPSSLSATAAESQHHELDLSIPSPREVAQTLQDRHEFTNPNQLKDAARLLRITDALGSTIASPRQSLGGGALDSSTRL